MEKVFGGQNKKETFSVSHELQCVQPVDVMSQGLWFKKHLRLHQQVVVRTVREAASGGPWARNVAVLSNWGAWEIAYKHGPFRSVLVGKHGLVSTLGSQVQLIQNGLSSSKA